MQEKIFKVKEGEEEAFEFGVFGGECFLKNYPTIKTTGVKCRQFEPDGLWYVINEKTNRPFSDCSFFNDDELNYMEEV